MGIEIEVVLSFSFGGDKGVGFEYILERVFKEKLYNGTLDCAAKIYKKEGVYGFFKGSFSNIVRSVGSSLVLVLYDEIQKAVKKQKNKGNAVKIVPTPKAAAEPVKKNN